MPLNVEFQRIISNPIVTPCTDEYPSPNDAEREAFHKEAAKPKEDVKVPEEVKAPEEVKFPVQAPTPGETRRVSFYFVCKGSTCHLMCVCPLLRIYRRNCCQSRMLQSQIGMIRFIHR